MKQSKNSVKPQYNASRKVSAIGVLLITLMMLFTSNLMAQLNIPTRAGTTMVFGVFDGSEANGSGEVTFNLSGVITGVPAGSLSASDTLRVDTVYSFSSLESLFVSDTFGIVIYDTVYKRYYFQNQGNLSSDSFYVLVVADTSQNNTFIPNDIDIMKGDSSTFQANSGGNGVDSAFYGRFLSEGSLDTFVVRLIVPGPASAADGDSLRLIITVKDSFGSGGWDAWPDTVNGAWTVKKIIVDTSGSMLFTKNDTLLESGDTQIDTILITTAGPTIRIRTSTGVIGGAIKPSPGDTLQYSIYYDNDGGAGTQDTGFIVGYIPDGAAFLDTLGNFTHTAGSIVTNYRYNNTTWIDHIPSGIGTAYRDSLLRINAVRFAVSPDISAQDTTGDGIFGGDSPDNGVADGDSVDSDAGIVKFRVRIR